MPHFRTGIHSIFAQDGGAGNWIAGASVNFAGTTATGVGQLCRLQRGAGRPSALHCSFERISVARYIADLFELTGIQWGIRGGLGPAWSDLCSTPRPEGRGTVATNDLFLVWSPT